MADPPDMDALAKRYIELWQEQLSRMATDPSTTDAWRAVFKAAAKNFGWTPDTVATFTTAAQTGTPASATSSGDGGPDLTDVLRRLDALEQRISALETDQGSD